MKLFSITVLFLVSFCSVSMAYEDIFCCQMNEPVKTSLDKKFTFKINSDVIRFLPEGHLAPGLITYMNENGPYFLAYIKHSSNGSFGEIEFSPGNSFDGKHGLLNYSDQNLSFSAQCSKF